MIRHKVRKTILAVVAILLAGVFAASPASATPVASGGGVDSFHVLVTYESPGTAPMTLEGNSSGTEPNISPVYGDCGVSYINGHRSGGHIGWSFGFYDLCFGATSYSWTVEYVTEGRDFSHSGGGGLFFRHEWAGGDGIYAPHPTSAFLHIVACRFRCAEGNPSNTVG
jgi:hypothetical protein